MVAVVGKDTGMNIKEIKQHLPHAYPFLLVDRVISIDLESKKIIAQKNVSINEPFFQGHFPDEPIMPGVLIVEALAQTGAIFMSKVGVDGLLVLLGGKNIKFRRAVYPGDVLMLHLEITHSSSVGGKCRGVAYVDGKVCAEGEMSFSVLKKRETEGNV
jgi:3-hydroxyacyl-[acyl-carrier-protein] dehydratase